MDENKNVFEILSSLNVNEHVEKKNTGKCSLSYLSWTYALAEVLKRYPDATWEVKLFDGKPYIYDENTGYMVFTSVTINGVTREMWLPVMDSHNDAMLNKPYEVKTKYGSYTVDKCTMFDVNKTIMRCITKNLAAFGLGLYIYSGEDLPMDSEDKKAPTSNPSPSPVGANELANLTKSVQDYIKNGVLTGDLATRAQEHINNHNIDGLKNTIQYVTSLKKGA